MANSLLAKTIFMEMLKIDPTSINCSFNFMDIPKEILTCNGLDFMWENVDFLDTFTLIVSNKSPIK